MIRNKRHKKIIKRERGRLLGINLSNEKINPETGGVDFGLKFDLTKSTAMAINTYSNEIIANDRLIHGYFGENKFRETFELKTNPDDHTYCFNNKFAKFKHVISIDTNVFTYKSVYYDKEIARGLGIAVGLDEKQNEYLLRPIEFPFITEADLEKPENRNWVCIINFMIANCNCNDERKIAIVVDSDLGNIQKYNNKEIPIYNGFYLPDNFELIFASDKVTDNIFNLMIRASHKISKNLIPSCISRFLEYELTLKEKLPPTQA